MQPASAIFYSRVMPFLSVAGFALVWIFRQSDLIWQWYVLGLGLAILLLLVDSWRGRYWLQKYLPLSKTGLLTRSILMVVLYRVLFFFLLTSSSSLIGVGLSTGLLVWTSCELLQQRSNVALFQQTFLWQVRVGAWQKENQQWLVGLILCVDGVLIGLSLV